MTLGIVLVRLWYASLAGWVGPVWAVLILAVEGFLVALLLWYGVRRARARRQPAPPPPA